MKRPDIITEDELQILELFNEKKGKYGVRRLKMAYDRRFKTRINIKKIKRIKKKFGLKTIIRIKSKYKAGFIQGDEHRVAPNFVQRDFSPKEDVIVLSVDVTELNYMGNKKAYLFAAKELKSKKLVHYSLKERPVIEVATDGLSEFLMGLPLDVRHKMIIHSDQGFQFTGIQFRSILNNCSVLQSMSRKGNCLDNAPVESFFGHLKDELEYKKCSTFKELCSVVKKYISYYNYDRPQWGLKRKTPAEAGVELGLVL